MKECIGHGAYHEKRCPMCKEMLLHIYGPWRKHELEARADRKVLIQLFKQDFSHGVESVRLTDNFEWRADIRIPTTKIVKVI